MNIVTDSLKYLARVYEDGEHVDISAANYFQEALDEITRLTEELDVAKSQTSLYRGEMVTALGISPQGEDAVENFDQVVAAAAALRLRVVVLKEDKALWALSQENVVTAALVWDEAPGNRESCVILSERCLEYRAAIDAKGE